MFFSTLHLFASALSVIAPSTANLSSEETLYGGNVEYYICDEPVILDETLFVNGETGVLFQLDLTGDEYNPVGESTITTTYNKYLYITYGIFVDGVEITINSYNATRVAPSLYGSVSVYKVNSTPTLISEHWFKTLSSYDNGNDISTFGFTYDTGERFNIYLDLYLTYTLDVDPLSLVSDDYSQGYQDGFYWGQSSGFGNGYENGHQFNTKNFKS